MITGFADVNDYSFNQSTYEGCKGWCSKNNVPFNYYKPVANSTTERAKSTELAIDRGHNVIFLPGYEFGEIIARFAPKYPNVMFFGIDVTENDIPISVAEYDNVFCFSYFEEVAGYLAGYAATKEGYSQHGFLGGMKGLAVTRYGYGYVQGVDAAAQELNINAHVNFVYGGQFYGDNDITKYVDNWYKSGTEIIFACGGGIYTSAALAAKDNGRKVIGVDSDQSKVIDEEYGKGICVTSAMKGVDPTCRSVLDLLVKGQMPKEKFVRLGLVSSENLKLNYVGLPPETWSMQKFTISDYKVVVEDFIQGRREASKETSAPPTLSKHTTLTEYGNIK